MLATPIADRLRVFAFKGENVGQESLYARIGHGRLRSPQSRNISRRSAPYTPVGRCSFYATGLGTGVPSIIFNNQQSVVVQERLVM